MKNLLALFALLAGAACAQDVLTSQAATQTASGGITSAAANCNTQSACVWIVTPGAATASINLAGTFVATVQFEASVNGSVWTALTDTAGPSSATVAGTYYFNLYGSPFLRARASAYTSGTVNVSMASSLVPNSTALSNLSANLLFASDFTFNIGATSANRPQSIWANNITAASSLQGFSVTALQRFQITGKSQIFGATDGLFLFDNAASTGFTGLQFGGTTASFPELHVNGTTLEAKLADNSAYAPLAASAVIPGVLYSAAGTALPTCAVGINGESAVVSDATAPAYMTAYASGGGITAAVICSYNGTTYSWLTH